MQAPDRYPLQPVADDVIARLQTLYAVGSDAALARAMELPGSTVGSWRSRGVVPYANCVDAAISKRASLDWILFGLGTMRTSSDAAGDKPAGYSIDPSLMRAVIESALTLFQEENLHLPPAKFAELCMLAYEFERSAAKPDPKARVVQLMRFAA